MNLIITGASRGIGRAVVLAFARKGFNVAFCARREAPLEALAAEVKAIPESGGCYWEACDVSKPGAVESFGLRAQQQWGAFDVVVNNAGVFLPGEILSCDDGDLESMMETNLFSAYRLTRALVPAMLDARRGHIFNLCSIASLKAYSNGSLYSITKFALYGFSKSLRRELTDRGIRVTAVLPGATWTDSWEGIELPESRFMPAEDIASAIVQAWEMSPRTVVEEIVLRPQAGDI